MKARLSLVLAIAAFGAAPLTAQLTSDGLTTNTEMYFKLQGLLPHDPTIGNVISSPYQGELAPTSNTSDFSPYYVWCVDETHSATIGQSYYADVTELTSTIPGDFNDTRLGASEQAEYEWAAYLASQMDTNWTKGSGGDPNYATDQAQTVALQQAMWAILGEGSNPSAALAAFELTSYATAIGINTSTNFSVAPVTDFDGSDFNAADWYLVTCVPPRGYSSCNDQEFLAYSPTAPTPNVSPEPGTVALLAPGLAGLFGTRLRRRKKRV